MIKGLIMQRVNELRLPRLFSDIFITDGQAEIGFIEDENQTAVWWLLSDEELVCMTEDARDIVGRFRDSYTHRQRLSALRALSHLEERLSQRTAYRGREITWPIP